MKILCLAISRDYYLNSAKDYSKAMATEHEVYSCYPEAEPSHILGLAGHINCNWHEFDYEPIKKLHPDVVVTGNPRASWNRAPMLLLQMLGYPMVFAEYGWLPQRNHFYLDPIGLGSDSILSWPKVSDEQNFLKINFEKSVENLQALQKGYYQPRAKLHNLPAEFIFVPLQWEWDSSIIFDSFYFKSMDHLVAYVGSNFHDYPVVVKAHPLDKNRRRNCTMPNVMYAEPDTDPIALVQQSKAVFGINSTLLIESLVAEKPVATLGTNVASGKGVFYEGQELYKNPRGLLKFNPVRDKIAFVIQLLLEWQIQFADPDMRKINRVLNLALQLKQWKETNGYYNA